VTDIDRLRHDDGAPSAYEIVEEFWPYGGTRDPFFTSSAATAVAHLVRYLNISTQHADALSDVPALGRVVSGLSATVYRLDQLLGQLATAAERFADDPTLRDEQHPGKQSGATARELALMLRATRDEMRNVRPLIDLADQLGSRLGHQSEGET
jgi:hypothetical protein